MTSCGSSNLMADDEALSRVGRGLEQLEAKARLCSGLAWSWPGQPVSAVRAEGPEQRRRSKTRGQNLTVRNVGTKGPKCMRMGVLVLNDQRQGRWVICWKRKAGVELRREAKVQVAAWRGTQFAQSGLQDDPCIFFRRLFLDLLQRNLPKGELFQAEEHPFSATSRSTTETFRCQKISLSSSPKSLSHVFKSGTNPRKKWLYERQDNSKIII